MCLAIPAKICELLEDKRVIVDITGVKREADTSLLEEPLEIGDYVLIHTGFIISKLKLGVHFVDTILRTFAR